MYSESPLDEIGVINCNKLNSQAKIIYKKYCGLKKKTATLRKRKNVFKDRLRKSLNKEEIFTEITSKLNFTLKDFFKTQINLSSRKPKGRRYTINDKIMGLILYKQSGRSYRLLSKFFSLPSRKTLMSLLKRIPIKPGLNDVIFDNLKSNVQNWNPREKNCILLFDEMSIQPHLNFNSSAQTVEGFEDFGDKKTNLIADHAQVFMVKGITKKCKQPLAYMFTKSSMKTVDLARILKDIIKKCFGAGLNIIATVCDQGSTNQAAINYLNKFSNKDNNKERFKYFEVLDKKIINLFDSPHLIKGIRN